MSLAMVIKYEYADLLSLAALHGNKLRLPEDASNVINSLLRKVTRPGYTRAPRFARNRRGKPMMRDAGPPPKYEPKPKADKGALKTGEDDLRKLFNKLTGSKYDVLMPKLRAHIETMKQIDGFAESSVVSVLFDVIAGTPFYSRMYAKCYTTLAQDNPFLEDAIAKKLSDYKEMIKDIEVADPNKDYDRYCELNKVSNRRQALGKFLVALGEEGLLSREIATGVIADVLGECKGRWAAEDNKEQADMLVTLLGSIIIDNEFAKSIVNGSCLKQSIEDIASSKAKSLPSLSHKAIFKFMDMRDYLNTSTAGD